MLFENILKKDAKKKAFKTFKELTKNFSIFEVNEKDRTYSQVGDIRLFSASYPFYFAVLDITLFYQDLVFICAVLSEDLELGILDENTPIIAISDFKTVIVALPFWIYLMEDFLYKYSKRIYNINQNDLERIRNYVETIQITKFKGYSKKYIREVMKIFAPYNTLSIFRIIEELEK